MTVRKFIIETTIEDRATVPDDLDMMADEMLDFLTADGTLGSPDWVRSFDSCDPISETMRDYNS